MAVTRIHTSRLTGVKLLLLLLLTAGTTIAQPRLQEPEFFIGAYGGVTASTVFFTPKVSGMSDLTKVPIGYNGGLVFRYGAHKVCSMQVEAGYVQRGWREYATNGEYDYQRKLHYIQIPFLAHIHFGGEYVQGFFNLGPEIAYCLHSEESGTKQTYSDYQYRPIDHPFEWGVAGGVGVYGIGRKVGVFQLELRVHYGFSSLYNNSRAEHFAASNALTASINFAYLWQVK